MKRMILAAMVSLVAFNANAKQAPAILLGVCHIHADTARALTMRRDEGVSFEQISAEMNSDGDKTPVSETTNDILVFIYQHPNETPREMYDAGLNNCLATLPRLHANHYK